MHECIYVCMYDMEQQNAFHLLCQNGQFCKSGHGYATFTKLSLAMYISMIYSQFYTVTLHLMFYVCGF